MEYQQKAEARLASADLFEADREAAYRAVRAYRTGPDDWYARNMRDQALTGCRR